MLKTVVYTPVSGRRGRRGPPGSQYLLLFAKDGTTDNIGVLSTDYDSVGTDLQTVLFSAPSVPIVFLTWQDFYDALSLLDNFNLLNYMANSTTILIYEDGTSREILNKALRSLGLPQVFDPFGPTWAEPGTWNDSEIWTE